jgi:hypothetical protein
MPKETVHDLSDQYDVQVGWTNDGGSVQLGVETADHRTIVDRLVLDGLSEADAAKVRVLLDDMLGQGQLAAFTGLWATLDWAGCNRVIRLVREARDKAFGRPE